MYYLKVLVTINTISILLNYTRITYLLTPWSRVLLEKLTGLQLVKKFPSFYGTRRFLTCPYPQPAQSSPQTHIPLLEDPS
jgi:hypothetical protein